MAKKHKQATPVVTPTEATPVAPTTTALKVSRFQRTLEEQVASFVGAQKLEKMSDELALFVGWSQNNPPPEKVGVPSGDSVSGKVFAYCDSLLKEGKPIARKQVIEALVAQGLNRATVSTQLQRWSKRAKALA